MCREREQAEERKEKQNLYKDKYCRHAVQTYTQRALVNIIIEKGTMKYEEN